MATRAWNHTWNETHDCWKLLDNFTSNLAICRNITNMTKGWPKALSKNKTEGLIENITEDMLRKGPKNITIGVPKNMTKKSISPSTDGESTGECAISISC
jgi:hypothetical protein